MQLLNSASNESNQELFWIHMQYFKLKSLISKQPVTYNDSDNNTDWNPENQWKNDDCADDICPHEHYWKHRAHTRAAEMHP